MKLSENQKLKFHYGVAFDERLLSGDIVYSEGKDYVSYDLKHRNGKLQGKHLLDSSQIEAIVKLCQIEEIEKVSEKYNGHWDDAGSSSLVFRHVNGLKSVNIIEYFDRNILKNSSEKCVFDIVDILRKLVNLIYEKNRA